MKTLFGLFLTRRRSLIKAFMALMVLINLVAFSQLIATHAAGNNCKTSSPASAAYTVTVCITSPADGATISGLPNVSATVDVTGTNPGVSKLLFYLSGEYLLTDYQTPYTFALPTTKWVDGGRLLEVEVLMKDGFTSERAAITLNFNNGITQPPTNTNTFTPKTGSTPPAGQSFVLAAAGDGADGATNAGNVTDLIASWNPNLFLYLGDVYEEGTSAEFHNWYGTSSTFYGRFRSITNPVIGNHEYGAGGVAPGYFDYWDNVPRYYSYDAAGWHFIALDSNCALVPVCGVGQAQYQWLLSDLSSHTNICTIAYFHHPVYNVGEEGPTSSMNNLWALLAQYGVDIVLNGHDHDYQRWKPLDGNGVVSSSGVTEFVAGGSGHGLQRFLLNDNRLVVGFDETSSNAFGALRLQLNQHGAGYQYINTSGIFLDSGSVLCSGAPADTTPPSKPTNLGASADNPQIVHLTWNPSTDNVGVTGYSIYRDGSLLKTIGPMTSYDDATVLPDVTYTYRVRALDAAGKTSSQSDPLTFTTPGLLFSDGFEGGNFSQWTSVTGLAVQQQQVYAGLYAARGTSTGTATYAYKQLPQAQSELYYRLWFKIISQGANQVYLQRFRTGTNGAIMGAYINNTGKLSYRNDVTAVATASTTTVTPGVWHELQTHVRINGTSGQTEIWLDGLRIAALSKTENFGTTAIGRVQLGESSSGRTYDIALDRVALATAFIDSSNPPEGGTPPPTPTPTPTVPPTPTPTPTNTPPSAPVGPGTYDDTHAAWSYSGSWTSYSQAGPYNNTDHFTNAQNASASITFTGTQFTAYFTQYSNRGSADVWIDGVKRYTINQNGSLVWQQGWSLPTPLSNGTHTVEFKNPSADPAIYIDIDAIAIAGPVGPGTYDDTHAAWSYSGSWTSYSQAGPYNNTDHFTNAQNASASITFTGTQFTVYFTQYSNRGSADVWIDGVKRYTINQNGSLVWQQGWSLPTPLSNGTHTVEFKNPSADPAIYIDIDAIAIAGPVGPGTYDDTHAAWSYSGSWTSYSQAGPYNNTDHFTNAQNASASITFTGTQFTVYFTQYSNRGSADVWIDGVKRYTINQNGSLVWQQGWSLPTPLSNGTHTVEFKNPNADPATYIDIDAIQIQ